MRAIRPIAMARFIVFDTASVSDCSVYRKNDRAMVHNSRALRWIFAWFACRNGVKTGTFSYFFLALVAKIYHGDVIDVRHGFLVPNAGRGPVGH